MGFTGVLNCGQEVELVCVASRMNGVVEDAVAEGLVGLAEIVTTVVADAIPVGARTEDDEPSLFDLYPTTAPLRAAPTIASSKIAPMRHATRLQRVAYRSKNGTFRSTVTN